jgi:broad specificity phosphatase PhoE
MKWPKTLNIIRHGQSTYNALKHKKAADPLYQEFRAKFSAAIKGVVAGDVLGWGVPDAVRAMAVELQGRYCLNASDFAVPLTDEGVEQARVTGRHLKGAEQLPDVILYSPYLRTRQTLEGLIEGWGELAEVKTYEEDRLREQDHGIATLYADWRIFHVFNPEQAVFFRQQGPYWYRYPQGESVSDVKDRVRSLIDTTVREHAGLRVLWVSHHLTKLSIRSNLERLTPEQFIHLDEHEKPINCGVTTYTGSSATNRLTLARYNHKFY